MLEGEYHSAMDMRAVLPGFSPIPIGWGVFDSDQDLAFFLQAFHDMDTEIPDMDQLTRTLAEFHIKSEERFEELTRDRRPDGMKFGYHVTTHNGKLAQDNTWTRTWEEYFTQNMKRMLEHDEKEGGERPQELEELLQPLFDKVIPRLLRPMEMNGGEVKPSLIHGDLWYGNTSTDHENNVPIVYDACCFWGHNECELPIRCSHVFIDYKLTFHVLKMRSGPCEQRRDTDSAKPNREPISNTTPLHTQSKISKRGTHYTICK
jgi:fructosamine-3-kinase